MTGLIRAEWIRLRRRKDLWLMLAGLAVLTVIAYWGPLSSLDNQFVVPPGEPVPQEILDQMAAQRATFAFPQSILTILQASQIFVLAVVAYATAATLGAEFAYGTIRTSLVAASDRRGFLAVRLGALALLALLGVAIVVVLGCVLPFLALAAGYDLPGGQTIGVSGLVGYLASLALFALVVIGLVASLTILFRSSSAALVVTFIYIMLEALVVTRWYDRTDAVATAVRLLPSSDLQLLMSTARDAAHPVQTPFSGGGLPPGAVPATTWLIAMGLAWAAAFLLAANRLLGQAEIHE